MIPIKVEEDVRRLELILGYSSFRGNPKIYSEGSQEPSIVVERRVIDDNGKMKIISPYETQCDKN